MSKNQVIHRRTCQFCTVLDIEYLGKEKLTNLLQMKIVAIRTLCKLISYDFAPTTGLRFIFFYKLKGFVFSVIRWNGELNLLTGKFFQVVFCPSTTAVKIENLEGGFLKVSFLIFCF